MSVPGKASGLTPQQQAAIDTRAVSVALSAGAGCGKTFVLTRRFLSHLEPGPTADPLSSLVAITFTDRAAREMRDRIRAACQEQLRTCAEADVSHWLAIVRDLDTARISTIHSFCTMLLRRYAVEAGLDPKFTPIEPALAKTLLVEAVDHTLQTLLIDLHRDAEELVYQLGLAGAQSTLRLLVPQVYRLDRDTWSECTDEELMQTWLGLLQSRFRPQRLRELQASLAGREVRQILVDCPPPNDKMRIRYAVIGELLPRLHELEHQPERMKELRDACMMTGAAAKVWPNPEMHAHVMQAFKIFRAEIDSLLENWNFDPAQVLTAASLGLTGMRLAFRAADEYARRKRDSSQLDFDDLLTLARDLLRDQQQVRMRCQAEARLLMVDEFQDTDPVQAEIVRCLCGDELATGKLFLVGDAKQSIYRFRRADPRVFRELREQIPAAGRLPLSRNFRSQPAILNFVNALFDGALDGEYEPLEPHAEQCSPEPAIEFLWSAPPPIPGRLRFSMAEVRTVEARWIARRLRQLLSDSTPRIRDKGIAASGTGASGTGLRPAEPRDVVLLFRALSDLQFYEQALEAEDLPYYIVGGRSFFSQQEVYDMVHLCRCIQDPDDEVALLGVLRSPLFNLADETMYLLTATRARLADALFVTPPATVDSPQAERVCYAARVLTELRRDKDHLTLIELLQRAIDLTGYDAALLAEHLGSRKLANLRKLLNYARDFDQAGQFTLADLAAHLATFLIEDPKEAQAATQAESANVIRLMSIHQSKGLEFPIVVLPDLNRKKMDSRPEPRLDSELGPLIPIRSQFDEESEHLGMKLFQWKEHPEDDAEYLRLLYVATTRAADYLMLSAGSEKPLRFSSPWMSLLESRFDLQTGLIQRDPVTGTSNIPERSAARAPAIHVITAEPPTAPASKSSRRPPIRLDEFRDRLREAEPALISATALPFVPASNQPRSISVSRLEDLDQLLGPADRPSWILGAGARHIRVVTSRKGKPPAKGSMRTGLAGTTLWSDGPREPEELGGEVRLPATEAEQIGTLVHATLERLERQPTASAAEMVNAAWGGLSNQPLSDQIGRPAQEMLHDLLHSPLFQELASARQWLREIPFVIEATLPGANPRGKEHHCRIPGTFDALVEQADGTWCILDWKTRGVVEESAAADVLAHYELQLGLYCWAWDEWAGKLPDRLELILLGGGPQRLQITPTREYLDVVRRRVALCLEREDLY